MIEYADSFLTLRDQIDLVTLCSSSPFPQQFGYKGAVVICECRSETFPTKQEMIEQDAAGVPYVFCIRDPSTGNHTWFTLGDHLLNVPLIGREWRYGVTDCWEAFRSWTWQNRQIRLNKYPREFDWWNPSTQTNDANLYVQYHQAEGYQSFLPHFSEESERNPQIGDAVLMDVTGHKSVINHVGVFLGNDRVYHHLMGKESADTGLKVFQTLNFIMGWARR